MKNNQQDPAVKRSMLTIYFTSEMQENDPCYQAAASQLYQKNRPVIGIAIQVVKNGRGWIANQKGQTKYPVTPQCPGLECLVPEVR